MKLICLDLEGVLVPEIWVAFAEASKIPELKKTTRDEPDYDKLMRWRLSVLKEHGLGLKEIQETIASIDPLPGAKEFLDELRSFAQVIIISDTFTEFAQPLMKKLGWPTIFCNSLVVAEDGEITDDERTIFVAYQYAGSACINNTITGGAPLVAICPVALGPCIVIMFVCKLIGANIVRLILRAKRGKA